MKPITVLLVDDNPTFLDIASRFLQGHEQVTVVGIANGGREAIDKAQQLQPQVILIDLAMPDLAGLDAIPVLRSLLPQVAIIALTLLDTQSYREAAFAAGADGFIAKGDLNAQLLPAIQRVAGAAQAEIAESSQNGSEPSRRILIMEDDDSLRRLCTKVLEKTGYEVHQAATLQQARELIDQHTFNIFLCDIHMGRERGTDLLREQGDRLFQNGTQIIVMSAEGRYRSMCEQMGVEFYLEKPIAIRPLITLVDRLIQLERV